MYSLISVAALVVLMLAAWPCAAASGLSGASERRVRIVVQIPTRHHGGDLYIASNVNGWNPVDRRWQMRPDQGETPGRYAIDLPVQVIPEDGFAFKVTRGSWDTVEIDAAGLDIPNRLLRLADIPHDVQIFQLDIQIPGFADERDAEPPASTVVGNLDIFEFTSELLGNTRSIRVWLPEQYTAQPDEHLPVLYMHDGQNCFDRATSAFGSEWQIDESMTDLIAAGELPPMIVVGIDNAGADRAYEYNASYSTFGERRPYGETYVAMLVDELMPEIARRYRVRTGPEHTSLGGSSFGGNITMLAAMQHPGVFGRLLIESPAVPVVGPEFLKRIRAFAELNAWTPRGESFTGRVFVAMGTRETANDAYNARLVELMRELEPVFAAENHRIVVQEGAAHNEQAWAARFPDAVRFLFADD